MPGHIARARDHGWRARRQDFRVKSTINRRGLFSVGPVQVTTGDPFGLFKHTRAFGSAQNVLVYPRAVDLPDFFVPPANLPGEGRFRRRTHYVTPNAAGVRPYEFGDSFNRIHWPSSARTGELMVKIFELDPASDIWIVLDLERTCTSGTATSRQKSTASASPRRWRATS